MVTIGIVNNMPLAAVQSTERQFSELIASAARGVPYELRWFRLHGARPDYYGRLDDLWDSPLDGLIVTGAEPRAASLANEPYWPSLVRIIEWAAHHTASTIWSCLAAHAAVLHLDGVERRPSDEKIFGIFESVRVVEHPILAEMPSWSVPHSRWNGLAEHDLARNGYTVLLKSDDVGVDTFIKTVGRSLFVFIQSHPEYRTDSLLREYRRDVARYQDGHLLRHPQEPRNQSPSIDQLMIDWTNMAEHLFRNWLTFIQSAHLC